MAAPTPTTATTGTTGTTGTVSFFFDPSCPWTWITSRWFVDVAERRLLEVRWRAFSLTCINEGREVPEHKVDPMLHGQRALRVIESLGAEGRHADAGRFYTELGTRLHLRDEPAGDVTIAAAGTAAGIDDATSRAGDDRWDPLVRAAYDEIHAVLGDDVGSPALRLDSTGNALFGPILSPAPTGEDAERVLDATLALLSVPQFFELKRSRTDGPDLG